MAIYPTIPSTVTVHLGAPSNYARNVTVPFTDYIKNVASHEIYPTWPASALRANILAQISFVLNRIYTEHYRSMGYDFDVTNTTRYDQAYVPGGDVFENISQIVDEIFNNYIVRQGFIEPLFASFCDGRVTQCSGLSQWGSVALAQQGAIPYEILQYYYGDNIDIVRNAPLGDNTPSYLGRPLRRGSAGEDVRTIARQLNRIGKNYPAIPVISPVSEIFDAEVEAAVRVFQEIFNLDVDGIVGKATWYKIKEVWAGVKRLSDLLSEGLTITEAQRKYPEMLRYGDRGNGVRVVQYYLAFLGFFLPELPPIEVTGVFDEATRDAVYTFQSQRGLGVDGIVGRTTWNALQADYENLLYNLPPEYQQYASQIFPGQFLVPGDRGAAVTTIQQNLAKIGATDPAIPEIAVTGVYDAATQAAVIALQRQLGYDATGAVGPLLWQEIMTRGSSL